MTFANVPPTQGNDVVQQLFNTFIVPASGRSTEAKASRMLKWIMRANNPSQHAPQNASAKDIAEIRRKALQNVRRLATKHPEVAAEIMANTKPEDVQ